MFAHEYHFCDTETLHELKVNEYKITHKITAGTVSISEIYIFKF